MSHLTCTSSHICTGSKLINELITSYSLSLSLLHTRFSQPRSPLTCITLSLSNLIAVLVPPLLSLLLVLQAPWASSSLKITNRSFRHASPHLWNKLPVSLRQPCLNQSSSLSPSSLPPLSSSITPSLFHSKLKHTFSKNLFHHRHPYPSTGLTSRISDCFCFLLLIGFYRASICEGGLWSNSVRPSVCLSVTRVDCDKSKWCTADILIPHEMEITLLLSYQQRLVGDAPLSLKSALKVTHPFEKRRLRQISAYYVSIVRDSEKVSITTNIKSTTRFPMRYRWSAHVTPKCPKGWSKSDFWSKSQRVIVSSAVNLVRRSVS